MATPDRKLRRYDVHDDFKHSGLIEAGDFCFVGYCADNSKVGVAYPIHGALDHLERRMALVGLGLADVVKVDLLFQNIWDIPVMEEIFAERFGGVYPARKSFQTVFTDRNVLFQLDAIAYRDHKPADETA